MFCLRFFRRDPRPFFRFAKEIFPGNFEPSPSHKFIAQLEKSQKLKRLYSQNIDGLEQQAGIEKVVQVIIENFRTFSTFISVSRSYAHGPLSRVQCRVQNRRVAKRHFCQIGPFVPKRTPGRHVSRRD